MTFSRTSPVGGRVFDFGGLFLCSHAPPLSWKSEHDSACFCIGDVAGVLGSVVTRVTTFSRCSFPHGVVMPLTFATRVSSICRIRFSKSRGTSVLFLFLACRCAINSCSRSLMCTAIRLFGLEIEGSLGIFVFREEFPIVVNTPGDVFVGCLVPLLFFVGDAMMSVDFW